MNNESSVENYVSDVITTVRFRVHSMQPFETDRQLLEHIDKITDFAVFVGADHEQSYLAAAEVLEDKIEVFNAKMSIQDSIESF